MWRWPFRSAAVEPSRVVESPSTYWQRLALFTTALAKENTRPLLEGLASNGRDAALGSVSQLATLSSSDRQARIAIEFGEVDGGVPKLRAALTEAGPCLRAELFRRMPSHVRVELSDLECSSSSPASPLIAALADRIIREATR